MSIDAAEHSHRLPKGSHVTTNTTRIAALVLTIVGGLAASLALPASASAAPAGRATVVTAAATTTRVGAASSDWARFDSAVGPVGLYRDFDGSFSYATWQDTPAYRAHPNAAANEYSFKVLPQLVAGGRDPIVARIRSFVATTPKNIILTNYHEPERYGAGLFSTAQYRAGIVALAAIVRAQNALDGGSRRVSVILMNITFKGQWSTRPADWWPTDARDGGHADIVSADVYALPHATQTGCCPRGYTDGVNWQKPSFLMNFVRSFAVANNTDWSVSELGYLEDVHDPSRRAQALSDAVAYARANGADHVSYFDSSGPRADWRLRWSTPVGTDSLTSAAALRWRALASG